MLWLLHVCGALVYVVEVVTPPVNIYNFKKVQPSPIVQRKKCMFFLFFFSLTFLHFYNRFSFFSILYIEKKKKKKNDYHYATKFFFFCAIH